jgi:hypothetical protein
MGSAWESTAAKSARSPTLSVASPGDGPSCRREPFCEIYCRTSRSQDSNPRLKASLSAALVAVCRLAKTVNCRGEAQDGGQPVRRCRLEPMRHRVLEKSGGRARARRTCLRVGNRGHFSECPVIRHRNRSSPLRPEPPPPLTSMVCPARTVALRESENANQIGCCNPRPEHRQYAGPGNMPPRAGMGVWAGTMGADERC